MLRVAVVFGLLMLVLSSCSGRTATTPTTVPATATAPGVAALKPSTGVAASYKNISVQIGDRVITLANGSSEIEGAPGSASKIVTSYFGNEATGDLNNDGSSDVAFVLTQSQGGSGTFYYVVVALRTTDGYVGTNGVLLGDRIAPQTSQIVEGRLTVNYADRKPGEPMTTQPSVGVSKYLRVVGGKLTEVPR